MNPSPRCVYTNLIAPCVERRSCDSIVWWPRVDRSCDSMCGGGLGSVDRVIVPAPCVLMRILIGAFSTIHLQKNVSLLKLRSTNLRRQSLEEKVLENDLKYELSLFKADSR